MIVASRIREPSDIGQQSFGARHIKLAAGQHEILLSVDFPENEIARYHGVREAQSSLSITELQECRPSQIRFYNIVGELRGIRQTVD